MKSKKKVDENTIVNSSNVFKRIGVLIGSVIVFLLLAGIASSAMKATNESSQQEKAFTR